MTRDISALSDLVPDRQNPNKHTERGAALLRKSLSELGAGRSIVVDKHGVVLAGNATLEAAAELGLDIKPVRTSGSELVVVVRDDLDLNGDGPEARLARDLSIADNRVGQVSLEWDEQVLAQLADEGQADLGRWWFPNELADLMDKAASEMTGIPPEPESETCSCCGQPIKGRDEGR